MHKRKISAGTQDERTPQVETGNVSERREQSAESCEFKEALKRMPTLRMIY